jgi:hypothetical protein
MEAGAELTRARERNGVQSVAKETAAQITIRDRERRAASGAEHPRNVPPPDDFIDDVVVEAELMTISSRQVIVEDGVEDMRTVEERRPILEVWVKAGGVGAGVVLHGTDLVQRPREGVIHVKLQAMRRPLAESHRGRMIVGEIVVSAHEEREINLVIVESGQSKSRPVGIDLTKYVSDGLSNKCS